MREEKRREQKREMGRGEKCIERERGRRKEGGKGRERGRVKVTLKVVRQTAVGGEGGAT